MTSILGSTLNLKTEDVVDNYYNVVEETKAPWTFETLLPYLAKKYGQDEKLARTIIQCESRTKMVIGHLAVVGEDVGYWQINSYYHYSTALKRGYNIYLWEENLEYGFILLKERGTNPWLPSMKCWSKMIES